MTDAPFLKAVLTGIEARAGARPTTRDLAAPQFRLALQHLLALKEELVPGSDGHFGAFRRSTPSAFHPAGSPVDQILCVLGADPRSGNNPDELEAEVQRRLDTCVRALLSLLQRAQGSRDPGRPAADGSTNEV